MGSSVDSQLDEEGRYLSCEKKNDVGSDECETTIVGKNQMREAQ